jgi:GxxExxY protein
MPIEVTTDIIVLNQEEFHALAAKLLRIIFDVHNEFGRFLDEALYKNEIAARWAAAGLGKVGREVQVNVSHKAFRKSYFMDTLFNGGLMLEAKVADALSPIHRAQGLNYMFLTGMKHSLLANLRPERVEHEFLSTTLTPIERRKFSLVDAGWQALNEESKYLRETLDELLLDWGAFLEIGLYREAVTHLLGGTERVVGRVPVYSGERLVGNQPVHFLTADAAFAFTALPRNRAAMEDHQRRFLKHTPLRCIQWVNFNRHNIEFTTLTK